MKHFRFILTDWCLRLFGAKYDTAGLCALARRLGTGLDLVARDQWGTVQDHNVKMGCVLPDMGLDAAGQPMGPFVPSFNNPDQAQRVHNAIGLAIKEAAMARIPYVIVFTGMDTHEDRDEQFRRIVEGFTEIRGTAKESLVAMAERLGVTLVIEMLNTVGEGVTWKGHEGYLGNSTSEVVEKVVKPINSKNFLIAFDIYHVVMMGENPITMIELYHMFIGYIHVAGVMPGKRRYRGATEPRGIAPRGAEDQLPSRDAATGTARAERHARTRRVHPQRVGSDTCRNESQESHRTVRCLETNPQENNAREIPVRMRAGVSFKKLDQRYKPAPPFVASLLTASYPPPAS